MRIAFTTLGCKVNQYETENLRVCNGTLSGLGDGLQKGLVQVVGEGVVPV